MAVRLEDLLIPFLTRQNLAVFLVPRDWDWLATTSALIRDIATLHWSYSLLGNDPRHPWFVSDAEIAELPLETVLITE